MSEKYIVCQGAKVYCSQSLACNTPATAVPLTVTSQTLVEANGGKLVATEQDCTVLNANFNVCNDPKYPTSPPPCMANIQWTKVYENVDISPQGLKMLTEESEGICNVCSVPGKIRIAFHGQEATVTNEMLEEAPQSVMAVLCPLGESRENRENKEQSTIITKM